MKIRILPFCGYCELLCRLYFAISMFWCLIGSKEKRNSLLSVDFRFSCRYFWNFMGTLLLKENKTCTIDLFPLFKSNALLILASISKLNKQDKYKKLPKCFFKSRFVIAVSFEQNILMTRTKKHLKDQLFFWAIH